jgi:hypothetical protein
VSYVHVEQLEDVRYEYAAAAAALACLAREWHTLREAPEVRLIGLSHVAQASRNIEITYIIRLFAVFESILVHHLATVHPGLRVPHTAEALINRVALRERIPDPIRSAAQTVREYRNTLVHHRAAIVPEMRLARVVAALNRFLARLP